MYQIIKIIDNSKIINYHAKLNPKLWNNEKLIPEIKNMIKIIVDEFVNELSNNKIKINIKDIYFVGSNASYNYTEFSDIDIHIIISKNSDLKLYDAYRKVFNLKYNIKIKGYPVQIYIEKENNISKKYNGIYSIYNNDWIKKPIKENIIIDEIEFKRVLKEYTNKYKDLLKKLKNEPLKSSINMINKFWDDIYKLRKEGLNRSGEFDINNLVFKEIRNKGYLNKLNDIEIKLLNKKMTLDVDIIEQSKKRIENLLGKSYDILINELYKIIYRELEEYDIDIAITGLDFTGSQRFGNPNENSDLDVIMTYTSNNKRVKEDFLFNILNEDHMIFYGFSLDINPIEDGDINEYIKTASKYIKDTNIIDGYIDKHGNTIN